VPPCWNPADPGNGRASRRSGLRRRAGTSGQAQESALKGLERAFAVIAKDRPDALVTCWDSVTLAHARAIAEFALKQHLPTLAPIKEYVEAGSLMSLGIDLPAHHRRTAYYVDRVLKGSKPGALPVERPLQFDLVLNLGTARALGITPPSGILLLADDLIR
jgi:putative ABC transport system substrate-binding protein